MEKHRTLWEPAAGLTQAPRVEYPRLQGDARVDVAVIGGGIAGVMAAWYLKAQGARVAVVERYRIGSGVTGETTAHLTGLADVSFAQFRLAKGRTRARQTWDAGMEAIDLIGELVCDLSLDCDFERVPAVVFAPSAAQRPALLAEQAALQSLGIVLGHYVDLPLVHAASFQVARQAQVHPLKFLRAIAARIPGDGCQVFEHTPALHTRAGRVITPEGTIYAEDIVVAAHYPFDELRIDTKLEPSITYALAARGAHGLEKALYFDNLDPYHYIRLHGEHVLVGGEDHPSGEPMDTRARLDALEQYTRKHIAPDAQIDYCWSGEILDTLDGLPYIGRRTAHRYVATGFSGTGITFGALSGRINADLVGGRDNPYAALFQPTRVRSLKQIIYFNTRVAASMLRGWAKPVRKSRTARLNPGEGIVVRKRGLPVAVSRSEDGQLRAVSAICTHLGCIVEWNRAEQSWDCPCHGSRFTAEGEVHTGPATRALKAVKAPNDHAEARENLGEEEGLDTELPPGPPPPLAQRREGPPMADETRPD
jgi:glycine/D-amino acid oxidase-like deaminating enzyme/nitrite reductase/ring-hydroxylating ferredoxin subunit